MMTRIPIVLALLAGLVVVQPAVIVRPLAQDVTDVVFDEIEKRVIRDFFGVKSAGAGKSKKKGKSGNLPQGLAKRDRLPPGLEQQLQRFGRLPPGIAKRSLPADLESRLRRRQGIDRVIVGGYVLLVQRATGVILYILKDVLTQ